MATSVRAALLALSLSLVSIAPTTANAERDRGGGGGGGGRLGQVSSGLREATAGGGTSHPTPSPAPAPYVQRYHYEDRAEYWGYPAAGVAVTGAGVATSATSGPPPRSNPVSIDFFAGAQKVHESDGSVSLELAFNEGRFRLGGSLSHYFERQASPETLTFTIGALYLGLRIDDGGATRAYLEAGVVGAETDHDPVMDSSVSGVLGGVRVEHRVARGTTLVGDAQAMVFEQDIRAGAVRAGVRFGHLQATLRYLDLNVGPALFGPEVGIRF